MLERVGLSGQHFVVCLDRACADDHCASRRAHLLLLAEDHPTFTPSPEEIVEPSKARHSRLISAVALAKFHVAAALAHLQYDFLFLELDVWLRKNPRSLFLPHASGEGGYPDVFIGGHCKWTFTLSGEDAISVSSDPTSFQFTHNPQAVVNPWSLNIGFYFVTSTPRTAGLFDALSQFVVDNPAVHDQALMNCILRTNATRTPDHSHEASPCVFPKPPSADAVNVTIRPTVREAINAVYRVQVFDPLQVINADTFDVYPETVVVHILSAAPLASRVGKINVAKEWMLYEGSHGYYDVRPGSTRLLIHDGPLHATLLGHGYRGEKALITYLLHLVALAQATDRILVLPHIVHFQRYLPAWVLIDTVSLEKAAGVSWRARRFLERARFPTSRAPRSEEELLEMAQVRILRREGLVGLKTGITLAKAEAWRAMLDTEERTAFNLQGDGIQEQWYHLDKGNTTRHWMQVTNLLRTEGVLRDFPILRVSMDMASISSSPTLVEPPEVEALRNVVRVCARGQGNNNEFYAKRKRNIDPANVDCHEWLESQRR